MKSKKWFVVINGLLLFFYSSAARINQTPPSIVPRPKQTPPSIVPRPKQTPPPIAPKPKPIPPPITPRPQPSSLSSKSEVVNEIGSLPIPTRPTPSPRSISSLEVNLQKYQSGLNHYLEVKKIWMNDLKVFENSPMFKNGKNKEKIDAKMLEFYNEGKKINSEINQFKDKITKLESQIKLLKK